MGGLTTPLFLGRLRPSNRSNTYQLVICLFDLWFSVSVNSFWTCRDVASTLLDIYPKLGCHATTQNVLENITKSRQLRYMYELEPLLLGKLRPSMWLTCNQMISLWKNVSSLVFLTR